MVLYLQKLKMDNDSFEKILIVCSTEMKGIKFNKNKDKLSFFSNSPSLFKFF